MVALAILPPLLLFIAFSLRGGVMLRVSGWFFLLAGIFTPFARHGNANKALLDLLIGAALLLAGHWAYAFAYYHYKSPRAERVIERGILPLLRARPGLYRAQGPFASALRNSGAMISRVILRSASGVEKVRPPTAPPELGELAASAPHEPATPEMAEVALSRLREVGRSVRERIGVSRRRHRQLHESLVKEQALSAELREQIDALEARDRAREDRLNAALAEAETFLGGLDRSISAIAAQVATDRLDEKEIAAAMQAMLGGRVRSVVILRVEQLSAEVRAFVSERGDLTTWMRDQANDTGEHPLEMTAALAGQRAILVTYADGVYDDGPLSGLVEDLSHAVVASLAGRDLAREKGRRLPISLLGDVQAYRRLAALRDAQGSPLARIAVRIDEHAYQEFTGVFGEPAWNAELFALASELDGAARSVAGEVFEIGNELVCLVAPGQRAALRTRFTAILERAGVRAEMIDT